jgi:mono/diheme cytochrome c family protein
VLLLAAAPYAAVADEPAPANQDIVERGKYIVTTSACNDCHTPWKMGPYGPEPDMERLLSGHPESLELPPPPALDPGPWVMVGSATNTAWSGPWGISYTANLTPDPETGLGKWTLRTFTDAIRTGRHEGRGRLILPPMPIPMYKHFSDADLEAMFAYLQSIPAIRNRVPAPVLSMEAPGD